MQIYKKNATQNNSEHSEHSEIIQRKLQRTYREHEREHKREDQREWEERTIREHLQSVPSHIRPQDKFFMGINTSQSSLFSDLNISDSFQYWRNLGGIFAKYWRWINTNLLSDPDLNISSRCQYWWEVGQSFATTLVRFPNSLHKRGGEPDYHYTLSRPKASHRKWLLFSSGKDLKIHSKIDYFQERLQVPCE